MQAPKHKINEHFIEQKSIRFDHLKDELLNLLLAVKEAVGYVRPPTKEIKILDVSAINNKQIEISQIIPDGYVIYLIYRGIIYSENEHFVMINNISSERKIVSWDSNNPNITNNVIELNVEVDDHIELLYFILPEEVFNIINQSL